MMNFEDYKNNLNGKDNFAPGMDSIYNTLSTLYIGQEPTSYKLFNINRVLFDKPNSLEGFSVYESNSSIAHKHIISFGFSKLLGNVHNYMREVSSFGYELTFRTTKNSDEYYKEIFMAMENIYRFSKDTSFMLEENTFIDYRETIDSDSSIAGFLIVKDKELEPMNTVHGSVKFLQLYPIDNCTLSTLKSGKFKIEDIIEVLEEDNHLLICS